MISGREKFIRKFYKHLVRKLKTIVSAHLIGGENEETPDCIAIEQKENDLLKGKYRKRIEFLFEKKSEEGECKYFSSPFGVEEDANVLIRSYSPDSQKQILVTQKESEGKKEMYIELWENKDCVQALHLKKHLKFLYNDVVFGGISWSPNQNRICFVAEKNPKEFKSFWEEEKEENKEKEEPYDQFKYEPDFGEQLNDKIFPILVYYDIPKNEVHSLDISEVNAYPATPIFADEETIIFNGIEIEFTKIGLFYCYNHPSKLYSLSKITDEKPTITKLTKEFLSVCPILSPDNKRLVYFASQKEFVSHVTCMELRSINWPYNPEESSQVIIPQIINPESEKAFQGLFGYHHIFSTQKVKFIEGSRYLILNSVQRQRTVPFVVDVEKKSINELTDPLYCDYDEKLILDIRPQNLILKCSCINCPPKIVRVTNFLIEDQELNLQKCKWEEIWKTTLNPAIEEEFLLQDTISHLKFEKIEYNGAEGFLWHPTHGEFKDKRLPLLAIIHGGPHSTFQQAFSGVLLFFLSMGYSVLGINYRGSCGYGLEFLECLLGNSSKYDLEDCGEIIKLALQNFPDIIDTNNVNAYGGSHGGYLSSWLISHPKYCKLFRSAVILNPVISFVGNEFCSDIFDWCFAESCNSKPSWPITQEQITKMHEVSPISQVHNVITPSLFLLGGKDRRVPKYNGLAFHRALQKQKVESKVLYFPDDCHPLDSAETSAQVHLNMINWLEIHKSQ